MSSSNNLSPSVRSSASRRSQRSRQSQSKRNWGAPKGPGPSIGGGGLEENLLGLARGLSLVRQTTHLRLLSVRPSLLSMMKLLSRPCVVCRVGMERASVSKAATVRSKPIGVDLNSLVSNLDCMSSPSTPSGLEKLMLFQWVTYLC